MTRHSPYINKVRRNKRFEFAEKHLYCTEKFWDTVISSDTTKFNIFGADAGKRVWRKVVEGMHPCNTIRRVKPGRGNMMLWGCMSENGVWNIEFVDTPMNQKQYNNILKSNLNASAEKMSHSGRSIFQHGNDPDHTAHNAKMWVLFNTPKTLKLPLQCPDLNPIKH